jgi:hypothetical protein
MIRASHVQLNESTAQVDHAPTYSAGGADPITLRV